MGHRCSGGTAKGCYEVYYIKEDALKLLLAGLGQKQWYGLFSGAGDSACRVWECPQAVNGVLADMYQNGIVDWEGAGVAVRQPYSGMLSAMLEKRGCVAVQMEGMAAPIRCCYLSASEVIMTHKSQREGRTVGLAQLSTAAWASLLEEECNRLEEGECCRLSCRNSENGSLYQKVRIQKDGLRTVSMVWEEGISRRLRFGREELGGRIMELSGAWQGLR